MRRNKRLDCYELSGTGRKIPHTAYFVDDTLRADSGRQYLLGDFMTKGGNGTIFFCKDAESNAPLAVKFLHVLDDSRRWRFLFETQLLSQLGHPKILPCFDVGSVETTTHFSTPFMITELYQTNIQRLVEKNLNHRLLPKESLSFSIDICEALAYIHDLGIIHRDMKPSNLFVIKNNGLVVGDFGLAKTATEAGADRFFRGDLTGDEETVGPLLWMSPELEKYATDKDYPVDHRSDLFQLGLILWYMLTGERPKGVLDEDEDPTAGQIAKIVQKLLHPKPEKRFQSATELRSALQLITI